MYENVRAVFYKYSLFKLVFVLELDKLDEIHYLLTHYSHFFLK